MSKALNIIGWLAITWVILHGIWNVGNFEGFTGDLKGAQIFEGIFALAVGISLLVIFLQLRRKQIGNTTANLAGLNRIPVRF